RLFVSTLGGPRRRCRVRRVARPRGCDVRGWGTALRERRDGLARADRRRAQREARHARPAGRKAGGGSARVAESTMFFPRLRSQAKWAFVRSEEHTSELQSRSDLVCRLLLEKKKKKKINKI